MADATCEAAVAELKARIPGVQVDFDDLLATPKFIRSSSRFLTEPEPDPEDWPPLPPGFPDPPKPDKSDSNRALKRFINENASLFGHDASVLAGARVTREFVTPRNRLRTVVWQQHVGGIPVFEAILMAHFSPGDTLVSLASQFLPNPSAAASSTTVSISAAEAVTLAARNIGEENADLSSFTAKEAAQGDELRQKFTGEPIAGEAEASLVWLPMDRSTMKLCWRVVLTGKTSGKLFQVLIDAGNGAALVRHCWTSSAVEATYLVFDQDSAAPMLPGLSSPGTNQAAVVSQTNITFTAHSTNASPAGWVNTNAAIFGLTNTTFGNNVDAHLDLTNGSPAYGGSVDPPRPAGVLTNGRVEFSGAAFTADLSQSPTNSANRTAAVVNAFYWCNWMHDVLYDLGFTEAAGNFQYDNLGRGGTNSVAGDPLQLDLQDSGNPNNAKTTTTPQDGSPGRMEVGLFNGPTPLRDASFDTTIIVHEYTHLLSARLVGAGAGISAYQSLGLGEGWSDFFADAFLSGPTNDPGGTYQFAAYAGYQLFGILNQNYYFGVRPYPCTTDLTKNPQVFGDILLDPTEDPHPGVPVSPLMAPNGSYLFNQIHALGGFWCVALWDARANLISKLGYTNGNRLMLKLTMDAMKLGPANPNFLESRNAILLADEINTGGQNALELWAAFAKRGMGYAATNGPSVV